MTGLRPIVIVLAGVAVMLTEACGPHRVAGPSRPGEEIIALLPDSDSGSVGQARVSNQSGSADLSAAREATHVAAGQSPAPPATLSEADVERLFGSALSALPQPPRRFTLNFQFDSDELTDEARALLPEILRTVKERPVPDVIIVGHTDTVGTPDANFALGLKRAIAVRDLLVQAGLDPTFIEVISHGEGDLLVKTADETPEPRNRRVELAVR